MRSQILRQVEITCNPSSIYLDLHSSQSYPEYQFLVLFNKDSLLLNKTLIKIPCGNTGLPWADLCGLRLGLGVPHCAILSFCMASNGSTHHHKCKIFGKENLSNYAILVFNFLFKSSRMSFISENSIWLPYELELLIC